MSALEITVIIIRAVHPQGRGQIKHEDGTIKLLIKKMLSTSRSDTFDWKSLLYLIAKFLNNTISKTLIVSQLTWYLENLNSDPFS